VVSEIFVPKLLKSDNPSSRYSRKCRGHSIYIQRWWVEVSTDVCSLYCVDRGTSIYQNQPKVTTHYSILTAYSVLFAKFGRNQLITFWRKFVIYLNQSLDVSENDRALINRLLCGRRRAEAQCFC